MRILLVTALLLAPAVAPADTTDAQKMKTDDCALARKHNRACVIDMGSETIEGGVGKSDGERVAIPEWGKLTSLIRIRREFIAEIVKTAEDI